MNWETIVGVITHPVTVTIITAIAGVSFRGFVKYKKAFKAFIDIPRAVINSRRDGSAGGKHITEAEYTRIGKEIVEFIEELPPLLKKGAHL